MGLITKYHTFVDGAVPNGALLAVRLNTNWDRLYTLVNGNIDQTNIYTGYKLSRYGALPTWASGYEGVFWYDTDGDKAYIGNASAWKGLSETDHDHDSDYAPIGEGVTNGDSHDHIGGDGAAITEGGLSLSDVTTGDVSTSAHGFCPKAPDDTSKFLRGDGSWAARSPILGSKRVAGFRAASDGFATMMSEVTTGGTPGTLADVTDDTSNWCSIQVNAGATNAGYIYTSSSLILVRRNHEFDVTWRIKTPATKPSFRFWVGLTSAHFTTNADDPGSIEVAMFRWSYNVGSGANWYACAKDGSTLNAVDTGVAFSAATAYTLRIWASSGKISFSIDGGTATELTDNLPAADTALILEAVAVSNDNSNGWAPRIGSGFVEWNG